ncbi:hypothetical protein [Rhizobium multihospitium]|uniref:Uncharacterized protein n=1 Tax=Rhizobium multihospitium TaxID=410764 RepID=A0A1C3W070_9HYPH|nr:hypothetical protein [Rhizobium multihospitium]SCB33359.1 hypothetical protein GA0061103_4607 [Rhizobium multihospitium]
MAITRKEEERALSAEEREVVTQTRHPEVQALPDDALNKLLRRLRDMRDRAKSQANQQRREMRGKSDPKGAAPKSSDAGSRLKASVLALSLKRLNAEIQRRASMSKNHSLVENARHALELKLQAQKNNIPYNTRHANQGMRDIPDKKVISLVRPAERGRLRKAAAVAQARRDASD